MPVMNCELCGDPWLPRIRAADRGRSRGRRTRDEPGGIGDRAITRFVEDLLLPARLTWGGRWNADRRTCRGLRLTRQRRSCCRTRITSGRSTEPVVIPGDVARLHQVVTNLLPTPACNTGPGTIVTTRLSTGRRTSCCRRSTMGRVFRRAAVRGFRAVRPAIRHGSKRR